MSLFAASASILACMLLAAISASATAFIAALFVDLAPLPLAWAPSPALVVVALGLGPLLLRRSAWRGALRPRLIGALCTLLFFASAAVLLEKPWFDDRVRRSALSMVLEAGIDARPFVLRDFIAAAPLQSASAAILLIVAIATIWRVGTRGYFAGLRHGEQPRGAEAARPSAAE
jgi:hypothetical protein